MTITTRPASRRVTSLTLRWATTTFSKAKHYKWSLTLTAINVTNKLALYNFLSTFSGTHYVTPRAVPAAQIGISLLTDVFPSEGSAGRTVLPFTFFLQIRQRHDRAPVVPGDVERAIPGSVTAVHLGPADRYCYTVVTSGRMPSQAHLTDEQTPRFQRRNDLRKKATVQVIEQHDQIKAREFKFVLGSVPCKKFEFDVPFKSGLTEFSNCHVGNVHYCNLPVPTRQPDSVSAESAG